MKVDAETLRASFERWAQENIPEPYNSLLKFSGEDFKHEGPGKYLMPVVQAAWAGWVAAHENLQQCGLQSLKTGRIFVHPCHNGNGDPTRPIYIVRGVAE